HPRRIQEPTREPPLEERHVPRSVRVAALARLPPLLRPQTRRRQEAQRCTHLPRPTPLQRHLGHAPHRPALHRPQPQQPPPRSRLTPLTRRWGHPPRTSSTATDTVAV